MERGNRRRGRPKSFAGLKPGGTIQALDRASRLTTIRYLAPVSTNTPVETHRLLGWLEASGEVSKMSSARCFPATFVKPLWLASKPGVSVQKVPKESRSAKW